MRRSVQYELQNVVPSGHGEHRPAMQNPLQATPQAPQLRGSMLTSVQTPPQTMRGVGQRQTPPAQTKPSGHLFPQKPQFLESVNRSVQTVPLDVEHVVLGLKQVQEPPTQLKPGPQTTPHRPQLFASV